MPEATVETLETAQEGFKRFRQGLATGEWDSFLEMLSDDFKWYFPAGSYQGLNEGKESIAEFLRYASEKVFNLGLTLTLERITTNEQTVVFEVVSEGQMFGKPYKNNAAISLDIRGNQICGYREYLGVIFKLAD